jgi:membrane fusion protein, multidrug efflux system
VPVRTEVVGVQAFRPEYSFFAVLNGIEETTASAKLADKVEKINYKVGDRVEKDAVVVTFPTDNPAAQYYQAKVAFEHAETTLKRIKTLYEEGGISLQEYDNTRTQHDVTKANWDAVRQAVMVKAPISGILSNLAVRESDNVKAGDVLFTVSKTGRLRTRVWASDSQIGDIAAGDSARATWGAVSLNGKVVQVELSIDPNKQAFGVEVEFDNTGNRMTSGVNAEIFITGKQRSESIMTNRKNVLSDGDSSYVFLARNGTAVKRIVGIGRSRGIEVEVVSGLAPGDSLITEGQMLLEDNTKISVKN